MGKTSSEKVILISWGPLEQWGRGKWRTIMELFIQLLGLWYTFLKTQRNRNQIKWGQQNFGQTNQIDYNPATQLPSAHWNWRLGSLLRVFACHYNSIFHFTTKLFRKGFEVLFFSSYKWKGRRRTAFFPLDIASVSVSYQNSNASVRF